MPQQYLSTDPNAGEPLAGGYLSADPDAGEAREGESLRGLSAAESFFGSHRPMAEGGAPQDAASRVLAFLNERLNPALQSVARPSTWGDMASLLIPGAAPHFRVPLVNMLRETLDASKKASSWRRVPGEVAGRLKTWATTPADVIRQQREATAPRLAGQAPDLTRVLSEALESVRTAAPESVSLPGGGVVRAGGPAPNVPAPSGPRMGAWSPPDLRAPSGAPPASASGAPPAGATPAPARSAPSPAPGIRLTPEESQALQQLVTEGYDEADVVKLIVQQRQAAPVASRQPSAPSSGKPSLNAAEAKEYQRLIRRGKSPADAMSLIEQQRAFQQAKGLPTSEQTRQSVVDRNATGRWD